MEKIIGKHAGKVGKSIYLQGTFKVHNMNNWQLFFHFFEIYNALCARFIIQINNEFEKLTTFLLFGSSIVFESLWARRNSPGIWRLLEDSFLMIPLLWWLLRPLETGGPVRPPPLAPFSLLWQDGLSFFSRREKKIAKNLPTQRKLFYFVNTVFP